MLLKTIGIVLMLDGVMSAVAAAGAIDTFVYRSLRDQSLVVAHILLGALLVLAGRQLWAGARRTVAAPAVLAMLVISAVEATRFDWLGLAVRAAYSAVVLAVLYRTTLPKT